MSRGYSPCPQNIVSLVATLVARSASRGALLDNCAGDGAAATALAEAWNLEPYFVEVDAARAAACERRGIGRVLHGSARYVEMSPGPSVWYFNPPFDPREPEGRLERNLFDVSVGYATSCRVLAILILPLRSLVGTGLGSRIVSTFERITVRRFPDREFERFGQVVVFGYSRGSARRQIEVPTKMFEDCPTLSAGEFLFAIPEQATRVATFRLRDAPPAIVIYGK
jgi:predicted RNA methylase